MIRTFWILVSLLLLAVVAAAGHYLSVDRGSTEREILSVASLVQFTEPSLSVSWYEPRTLHLEQCSIANPVYPEMSDMQRMDFVYGK